ncbi:MULTISPECIES: hypothetical protein [Staphylococcaceae]|uniref:hypothetical protein n=1 Tax=Staphylococcaceae TaxID=90964 RepID=UPI0010598022|nr:hypothetical protein [Macrococcus bohemicus]TDL38268.1 hypothetical protein EVU91_05000 [Macrococcus bohemicus]
MQQESLMEEIFNSNVLSEKQIKINKFLCYKAIKESEDFYEALPKLMKCKDELIADYYITKSLSK